MRRILRNISFVVLTAVLSSCTSKPPPPHYTVHVTDSVTGQPVAGASVVVIYPSGGGAPILTDKNGMATVPNGFGPLEYGIHLQVQTREGMTVLSKSAANSDHVEVKVGPFAH